MANLRVCPENFFDNAVLTASPAMVATMPETNAQLVARDRFARWPSILDTVTHTVTGHWNGNGRRINSFFIFDHLLRGSKVRLELFRKQDLTVSLYDSGVVDVIGPLVALGSLSWGIAPFGLDITEPLGVESPYSSFFAATDCSSFRLTFTKCQGAYRQFGRIYLGEYLEAPYSPDNGMSFGWSSNTALERYLGGTYRTRAGARWRELSANMIYADDATRAAWRDLLAKCTNKDLAVSIFPGAGGRLERDHVFNGKIAHQPFEYQPGNISRTTIRIAEV